MSRSPALVRKYKKSAMDRLGDSGAETGTIKVAFAGVVAEVEFSNQLAEFQRRCSKAFGGGIHPAEVVGFDNGNVLYPASFVAKANTSMFEGQTLRLILSREPAPAVPILHHEKRSSPVGILTNKEGVASLMFPLGDSQERVQFDNNDLKRLVYLKSRTGLNLKTCAEVVSLFTSLSTVSPSKKRILDKSSFDQCIRTLIPGTDMNDAEKQFLSLILNRIYFAFDRDQEGFVDLCQFLSGFIGLLSGDRTEKLRLSFQLFEDPADGTVSSSFLLEYFRSFLIVVLAICDGTAEFSTEYLFRLVDETAEIAAHRCLMYTGAHSTGKLRFDGFLVWYEGPGKACLPWLDLLTQGYDIALVQVGMQRAKEQSHEDQLSDQDDETEDSLSDADDETLVFEFPLAQGEFLKYTKVDMDNLQLILETTRLDTVPAIRVHELFVRHADEDQVLISKSQFDSVIRALVPGDRLTREEQGFLSFVFSNIYTKFSRSEDGEARLDELSTGFSVLCGGSKSDKLALGFERFQNKDTVIAQPVDLCRYIRSFFTVLLCLNEKFEALPEETFFRVADLTSAFAARLMLQFHKRGTHFSFKDFGTWYNQGGGQRSIPWLELLDLRKWPMMDISSTQVTQGASTLDEGEFSDDESDSQGSGDSGWSSEDDTGSASAHRGEESSEPQGRQVVFQFQLTEDGHVLEMTPQDLYNLELLLASSKLNQLQPAELLDYLSKGSVRGQVTKHAFDRCMHDLIRFNRLEPDIQEFVQHALDNIVLAYDRDASGAVSIKDLGCGMCFLTDAKKSDKLALGFSLMDGTGAGLDRAGLARYLAAYLTVLFAINGDASELSASSVWATVDRCTGEVAATVFRELDIAEDGLLSFEDFAEWYTNAGYELIPWVELLDLHKWPLSRELGSRGGDQVGPAQEEEAAPEGADRGLPVFRFRLTDAGEWLELFQRDVERLDSVLKSTRLHGVPVAKVFQVFAAEARDGRLEKGDFNHCAQTLVRLDNLNIDELKFVTFLLSNIFYAFDRESSDCVQLNEFASGFCLLSKGSKSEKLNLSFELFDHDNDGKLVRKELWLFIRSFLTVLLALNEAAANGPADVIWRLVDEAAVELAAKILLESAREDQDLISFEEFASWYTEGGFERMPWLELLDLRKWPLELSLGEQETKEPTANDVGEQQNVPEDVVESQDIETGADTAGKENIVFQFVLTSEGQHLDLTPRDVKNLHMIVETAGFEKFTAEDIHDAFNNYGDEGMLAKADFLQCIRELVPGLELSQEQKTYLSHALSNMFYAYDRDENGVVSLHEFACGFSILSKGTKSDKLQLAFHFFDANEDGLNTFEELVGFLRSFLTVLFALNEEASRIPAEEVWELVDQSTQEFARLIFSDLGLQMEGGRLSFEDFAGWYTQGGYAVVPWLELLNLQKWPDLSPQMADGGHETGSMVSEKENLGTNGITALLTSVELELLSNLAAVSSLESMTLSQVVDKLRACIDDELLDAACYERFLDGLVDMAGWGEDDVLNYKRCFRGIFESYDKSRTGAADLQSLAAGLSCMVAGSAESKLRHACEMFGGADAESVGLNWEELHRLFLGYYTIVAAAKAVLGEQDQKAEGRRMGLLAMEAVRHCFHHAGAEEKGRVTSDAVIAWYRENVDLWLPHLELNAAKEDGVGAEGQEAYKVEEKKSSTLQEGDGVEQDSETTPNPSSQEDGGVEQDLETTIIPRSQEDGSIERSSSNAETTISSNPEEDGGVEQNSSNTEVTPDPSFQADDSVEENPSNTDASAMSKEQDNGGNDEQLSIPSDGITRLGEEGENDTTIVDVAGEVEGDEDVKPRENEPVLQKDDEETRNVDQAKTATPNSEGDTNNLEIIAENTEPQDT